MATARSGYLLRACTPVGFHRSARRGYYTARFGRLRRKCLLHLKVTIVTCASRSSTGGTISTTTAVFTTRSIALRRPRRRTATCQFAARAEYAFEFSSLARPSSASAKRPYVNARDLDPVRGRIFGSTAAFSTRCTALRRPPTQTATCQFAERSELAFESSSRAWTPLLIIII